MHHASRIPLAFVLLSLGGCASIIEGTSQEILVSTNPSGASCVLEREGQPLTTIPSTPGTALVKKRKYDITIKCDKPGFLQATYLDHSGLASGAVAGNVAADLLLTAGLSSIIDSASGADNQYESPVNITLIPMSAVPQASPTAAPISTTTMQPVPDDTAAAPTPKKPKPAKAPTAPATPDAPKPPGN